MTETQYNAEYLLDGDQEPLRVERQAKIYGFADDLNQRQGFRLDAARRTVPRLAGRAMLPPDVYLFCPLFYIERRVP